MENVLQAPCGALKLADFGCASKGANGRLFETAGSLKCWAPEMIELADEGYCGFAADVWAGKDRQRHQHRQYEGQDLGRP